MPLFGRFASQVGVTVFQEPSPETHAGAARTVLERLAGPGGSPLPRLLLVFAHPDDEVLAVGARMEDLGTSRLLTLTDGAPVDGADARHHGFAALEAYRQARRHELLCALADAGLPSAFAPFFPEQVPDQAASLHLVSLTRAAAREIQALQPEAVLTHPYEGGHPDHDACAFVAHTAVRLVAKLEGAAPTPVVEAPFYHLSDTGSMKTGSFLNTTVPAFTRQLTPMEQQRKATRLACFTSQAETLAQFSLESESFRLAPAYDFLSPPHAGVLLYERFQWGMEGERFRALVAEALEELFPRVSPGQLP